MVEMRVLPRLHLLHSIRSHLARDKLILSCLASSPVHEARSSLRRDLFDYNTEFLLQLLEFPPDILDVLILWLKLLLFRNILRDHLTLNLKFLFFCKATLQNLLTRLIINFCVKLFEPVLIFLIIV